MRSMSMKKIFVLLVLCLAVLAFAAAQADTAVDVTDSCELKLSGKGTSKNLTDRKFTSFLESKKVKNPTLTVTGSGPLYGLYLCFQNMPDEYEIRVKNGGDWETFCEGDTRFHHVYYSLEGVESVQVYARGDGKQVMGFNEVYLFGDGEVPGWVQRWNPTPEKADILFVTARPEEELLYLGGAIPYYACEKDSNVALACMSFVNTTRRSELLNGLWSMGYRNYPFIGSFGNINAKSTAAAYKSAGEEKVLSWLTGVIRSCRPEVIVGPDAAGEGNNGMRMMLADACQKCFDLAADEGKYEGEAWEPQKLYLHLYGSAGAQTVFDWEKPLASLGGKTGRGLAYYAYLFHKTQDDTEKTVFGTGSTYANNTFGLVSSRVGEDSAREDFLENIPAERLTKADRGVEIYGWTPEDIPGWSDLSFNEKGFLTEGEFIWSDDERGTYAYVSPTTRVIIRRKFDGSLPLTWFESDIMIDTEAGELLRNVEYTPEKAVGKKSRVDAALNATENNLAFAVNMDYYTYRVGSKNGHPVGVEIRNGEVYFDDRYDYVEEKFFPNLDTLAFYMDGTANVHHSVELSAQEYLEKGAYLVYSFGPYLVRDGQLSEWVTDPTKSKAKNPRHAMGYVSPGHYVDIMCEGRLGSRSEGVTTPQLALLCQAAGCTEACNLDGGQTAVVIFMGQQLNKIGKYDGKTSARGTCEVLGVGVSDQVGTYEVQ